MINGEYNLGEAAAPFFCCIYNVSLRSRLYSWHYWPVFVTIMSSQDYISDDATSHAQNLLVPLICTIYSYRSFFRSLRTNLMQGFVINGALRSRGWLRSSTCSNWRYRIALVYYVLFLWEDEVSWSIDSYLFIIFAPLVYMNTSYLLLAS